MTKHLAAWSSGESLCLLISASPAAAQALKGAGTCLDEYKANTAALRAAKEKKDDFISAGRALPPARLRSRGVAKFSLMPKTSRSLEGPLEGEIEPRDTKRVV